MSIRWKLFVALFLLTAGTIAVVLIVAEREFHSWVRGEVTQRFEARLDGLLKARTERLADTRELCTKLATHPAIKAMLNGDRDPSLRTGFLSELAESRASMSGDRPGPGGRNLPDVITPRQPGQGRGLGQGQNPIRPGNPKGLPVVGVIDLDGRHLHLGQVIRRSAHHRRETAKRIGALSGEATQQVAYVTLDGSNTQRSMVQEVVLTPVLGDDGKPLGWFFLGTNAETRVERSFQMAQQAAGSEGHLGLIADGAWFVQGINDEQASSLASALGDGFWTAGKPEILKIDGKSVLIVASDLNPGSPLGKGYQVGIFPLDGFLRALANLRITVGWIGGAAVLATTLVAFFMAGRFSRPIAELVAGTERVRQGDLAGDVRVRSKDEFGALAKAFNAMTQDLALKERYREVLSKTSDPTVAQQLVEGQLELGGEIRHAAVLFCDIRGFTTMTEGMPPAEVIEFINEHMTALTKLVYFHGGVVDKFVGDLIMAVFGAPNSHGDDALRAARCALEMIQVRQELSTSSGRLVEIGIGLAYGELVAGCMGSTDRLNYTVLGDRVNLASRLCSEAGAGEVIVDEAIAAALDDSIQAEPRDPVTLKGFSAPVPSFAIRPKA